MSRRAQIFLGLFLFTEGTLFVLYCFRPAFHDNIAFGTTLLAAGFALFEFFQKTQHDRYESAGQFIERWNDPNRQQVRLEIRAILTDALLLSTLLKRSQRPDQFSDQQNMQRAQVLNALNFFEELAVAVHRKRADERYLYDYFDVTVREVWSKFFDFIQADRRFGDPSYWCEFETLAKRWASGAPWWV